MIVVKMSVTTTVSRERIWGLWSDAASWPTWDQGVIDVTLDGPFAQGVTGTLRPSGGPQTTFTLTEVTEGVSFTAVSKLPLARLAVAHTIEERERGMRITHTISLTGPAGWIFYLILGATLRRDLEEAMVRLVAMAEGADEPV